MTEPQGGPSAARSGRYSLGQERGALLLLALLLALSLAASGGCGGPAEAELLPEIVMPSPERRVACWREDLAHLAAELPRRHAGGYGESSRDAFDTLVAELDARIPELTDDEVVVELASVGASLGDGHTGIHLQWSRARLPRMPLRFERFADGVFVTGATAEHEDALRRELVAIGGVDVSEAVRRVARWVPHDNESALALLAPDLLALGPCLSLAGLAEEPGSARYTLRAPDGDERSFTCTALEAGAAPQWIDALAPDGERPLWRRDIGPCYGFEVQDDGRSVYLQYRRCQDDPAEPFAAFCERLFARVDELRPERLIVDLRRNGGGNSSVIAPLFQALSRRPWLDAPGHLFVLIGRGTFSSGLWAGIDFAQETSAVLVGEPTGGKPNAPGEVTRIVLPHSNLDVHVATRLWSRGGERFSGDSLPPDVAVAPSSADAFAGRDPVLASARKAASPHGGGRDGDVPASRGRR